MARRLKIGITCYPTLEDPALLRRSSGSCLRKEGMKFILLRIAFRSGLDNFIKISFIMKSKLTIITCFVIRPMILSLASKMAQVAKMQQLDLLHVHYAVPHAVCAYLAKQMVGDHLKDGNDAARHGYYGVGAG